MRTCSRWVRDCTPADGGVGGTGSETSWFSGVLVQADNNTASAMPRNRFAVVSVAAIAALLGSFNLQLDFDVLGAAATTLIGPTLPDPPAHRCHERQAFQCRRQQGPL